MTDNPKKEYNCTRPVKCGWKGTNPIFKFGGYILCPRCRSKIGNWREEPVKDVSR